MRDVQAVETDGAGGPQQLPHILGPYTDLTDVEPPVQIAQALPVGLPLVQGGAERGADPFADQTDEIRVLGHGVLLAERHT